MKLDFREIFDSGGEEEATPQLNQHSRNKKLPEAFQIQVTSLVLTNGSVTSAENLPPKYWDSTCTCPAFYHHQTGEGSFMIGASREEVVS